MRIETFIQQEILAPRMADKGVLVVYDPERRYHGTCTSMESEHCRVVDAGTSSITSREQAAQALVDLGQGAIEQLLVYVPASAPVDDEAKQRDPFSAVAASGRVFPDGDGDRFESLCFNAKPDQILELRKVFDADPNPPFAVIDALGGGVGWPTLRALLGAESSRDILLALMAPSPAQEQALKASDTWVNEARELLKSSLTLTLRTRGRAWSSIAEELWRYVLFSEFAFDLPCPLPHSLADLPKAPEAGRPVIFALCDDLRNDHRTQPVYIDRAQKLEQELGLAQHCAAIQDLGPRETFPFEERSALERGIAALLRDEVDGVRSVLDHQRRSVWAARGESRLKWDLLRAALELGLRCEELEEQLPQHDQDMARLLAFYTGSLREADRLHREFEQALGDFEWQDIQDAMKPVRQQARRAYGRLAEKTQQAFTRHLQAGGWPLVGQLANADVFDRFVALKLQQHGHKVAYLMIDALRYELGVALEQQLADDGVVALQAALAPLPTITPVGMAALLPGAGQQLSLRRDSAGLTPMLGDQPVANVAQRMDLLRKRYGQRFAEGRLEEYVRGRLEVPADADLLVLRAVEIDSHFENNPDTAPAEITNALRRIRMAIHRLAEAGFQDVVIASDHGFFINTHAGAGDVCGKPEGSWLIEHDRCALGDGVAGNTHYLMPADRLGVRGDFAKVAGPLTLAAYRAGLQYFHGGASLQESVVPVLTLQLKVQAQPALTRAVVSLAYKNGATKVTTRVPVIDVAADGADMFSADSAVEILLEAQDAKGNVVGEARAGGAVNAASGTLTLHAGEKVQVTLRMQLEFEGKFKVKALDPKTNEILSQLDLATDYTV
ncbi:PglZ domain-containing protein [Paraburkholderia phenoliruptrix]|uniref:PglZ domain-containing protein n=1 Tax=Paraburkholderia phenoliruptrix TaxID=252970 RepID=UPI001C6DEAA9|nr:PglZ domain-containing protein [Paraburkholderia phenoliruptrix]MBW9106093.1 PglZ domain-containing protein [Paraburkholderia phenoliruptrix]MBW9130973.1 PglZ domain-containing protein [Paraburkholderia ginsengiterrae]